MYTLAIIVGSLRTGSMNKQLADNLARLGKDLFNCVFVDLNDVPMLNQDLEADLPAGVVRLKQQVADADAVLLVTPEYNRSIPPLMKNAIDWGSRPYGQNSWGGKPTAIAGLAPGAVGTAAAQSHLRSVVTILGVKLMAQPEVYLTNSEGFFDSAGRLASADTEAFLAGFMKKFAAWVGKCKAAA